jgi:hypothetical protein
MSKVGILLRGTIALVAICTLVLAMGALAFIDGPVSATESAHSASRAEIHSHAVWVAERRHAAALRRTSATLANRATLVALTTPIALCEEGGWIGYASREFPDSLGLDSGNWFANGGGVDLRPFVQAKVEIRFDARWGIGLPDRIGCAGY